jgi:hypothetical protein
MTIQRHWQHWATQDTGRRQTKSHVSGENHTTDVSEGELYI